MVVLDATVVNIALPSRPDGPRLLQRRPAVDRHRLRARLRQPAAARRRASPTSSAASGRFIDRPGRLRRRLRPRRRRRRPSACSSPPAPLQGVFGALLAPAALVAADHDLHRPAGAGQGVRHLRRHRRRRRRGRPAARRRPHRVPVLALVPLRQPRLRRRRRRRRARSARARARRRTGRGSTSPAPCSPRPACSALVYGFSHAETDGWSTAAHARCLLAGAASCSSPSCVVAAPRRAPAAAAARRARPQPRRRPTSRSLIAGAGMFGVFLFLTYYLQQIAAASRPSRPASRFLPMIGRVVLARDSVDDRAVAALRPAAADRRSACAGRRGRHAAPDPARRRLDLRRHVLPGLLLMGLGLGLIFAPGDDDGHARASTGRTPVSPRRWSTPQQVGGSIGTALLNTLAASAVTSGLPVAPAARARLALAEASVHGYTTAFFWAAGFYAGGAIICAALLTTKSRAVGLARRRRAGARRRLTTRTQGRRPGHRSVCPPPLGRARAPRPGRDGPGGATPGRGPGRGPGLAAGAQGGRDRGGTGLRPGARGWGGRGGTGLAAGREGVGGPGWFSRRCGLAAGQPG